MSDNPKDDDWGMTMPNLRIDADGKPVAAQPPQNAAIPAAPDDWGVTEPNLKIPADAVPPVATPPSDFSRTVPNIDLSSDIPQAPRSSPRADDWEMPAPTFRVSDGATPNFDKTSPGFNLSNEGEASSSPFEPEAADNKTTPYYRLPDDMSFDTPQAPVAVIPEPVPTTETTKAAAPQSSGNMKWILMLGGIFCFFAIVIAALVGAYLVYFRAPVSVKTTNTDKKETPVAASTPAPAVASLPGSINFKGAMVLVEAGEFTMGSNAGTDESKPAHQVTLPAYYIDKTEVTNAQYKEFCTATGAKPPADPFWERGYFEKRPNAPVLGISFDDARAFASWAGKRLPTEQEWEKAASWNPATKSKNEFPWGPAFENNRAAFGLSTPKDAGSYPAGASPSGALDMAGNVAEWVDAFFQPYPGETAANPNFGEVNRIVRGGHFGSKSNDFLKTSKRIYVPPVIASGEDEEKLFAAAIGFRCAVSADDAALAELLRSAQSK